MTVALCPDQFFPGVGFEFLFHAQGITNLNEFGLDKLIVLIAVGMDIG